MTPSSWPEWQDGFSFEILAEDPASRARLGKLTTPHGVIFTPAFMPVGTYGAVKGISPEELQEAGAQIILSNALHLEFRPGSQIVRKLGGLHQLMGWSGPILTDSGGFQTFSLASLMKRRAEGLEIRSPVEGSKHLITPEKVIEIQRNLGTDFMMPLDICAPGDADRSTVVKALDQTTAWAKATRQAYDESEPLYGKAQAVFGIVQGGTHEDLRAEAVQQLLEIGFFAYAMGGLAVGESPADRWRAVELCDRLIPKENLRYLMGVGTPEDLDNAVSRGVDLFDCVLPTRNGRKGSIFTKAGKINLRNSTFREDDRPLEDDCTCYACRRRADGRPAFSRGAIRHLLSCSEVLGSRLGVLHNLTFFLKVLEIWRNKMAATAALTQTSGSKTSTPIKLNPVRRSS
jgi:queuine tRNA-ribosyltransferase